MEILLNDDCSEKVAYDFADFPVFIHRELLSEYPNRTAPSHWHTDLEFLLIYSGRLQYNVNGFVRTLHAGEGIFVNAQQLHFGFSDRDEECEFLCVLVHPTLLCITPAIQQRFVLPVLQNEALPVPDAGRTLAGRTSESSAADRRHSGGGRPRPVASAGGGVLRPVGPFV